MKPANYPIYFYFIVFSVFPLSLFCQATEEENLFPDEYSFHINQLINTSYKKKNYQLTKKYTYDLLEYAKKCEEEELTLLCYTALEYYSYSFNKREDFKLMAAEADVFFSAIISNENLSKYADYYFDHVNFYGVYLFRINKISEADTHISNAINLLENIDFKYHNKNYYLTVFYENLSSLKELQWNFNDGILLLEKTNNLQDKSDFSLGYINQNFSSFYQKTGNYPEALDYALLAVENYKNAYLNDSTEENAIFYSLSLIKLTNLYVLDNYPNQAFRCIEELKALPIEQIPLIKSRLFEASAQINLLEGKPKYALENYQKCLKIQQKRLSNRITEKVTVQKSIAQIYHKQHQLDSAFHYLQQAVVELTNNKNLKDIETNPDIFDRVVYKQSLLDILQNKSELLLEKYAQSLDICDLLFAQQTSESTQNLADKIRLELSSDFDKELFSKKGHNIYALAIKIASFLEDIEHSDANIDFAYRAIESSRALLLAEAVYQSNTKEFAGIPRDFIKREEIFREQIVEKERQIFQLEQEGQEATSYREKKWQLQSDFDNFTDSLKTLYPDYYKLKFAVQPPSLAVLQADLKTNNQNFIEYFLDEEHIYALITSADTKELKTWRRPAQLTDRIKALRKAIYAEEDYTKAPLDFVNNAHSLYKDLVAPLGDLPERLVIVPDGVLNYLPFDVLLTELPKYATNYQSHSYLLESKQISYDYSATLRMQKREKMNGKYNFMGFAPHYNQTTSLATRGVGELKFNIEEVDSIQTFLGGHIFVGDAAIKQKFKEQCDQASILHFAGHAVQEEINPDFSHLLFSGDTHYNNKNQMPVREIYARHINAQMVVLSACNTGMGEIQRGEGMYSLGRAFSYAGAQSLVSTLWSVNDKSTKEIMVNFYENLKIGMTKDQALQKAKLKYIENQTNVNSNPLYWAGFVAYGDMKELDLKSKPWWRF